MGSRNGEQRQAYWAGLTAGTAILTVAVLQGPADAGPPGPPANTGKPLEVPVEMRFEPAWREKGDCGPVSLYVLMAITGRKPSMDAVKKAIPFDPELGCSLADVARGADALGFATQIRFVKPGEVSGLTFPCIIHTTGSLEKGVGHFVVITGYDPERREYSIVNTSLETLDVRSERILLREFSGYVLLAVDSLGSAWPRPVGLAIAAVGIVAGLVGLIRRRRSGRGQKTGNGILELGKQDR
jgi:hypothetical protein